MAAWCLHPVPPHSNVKEHDCMKVVQMRTLAGPNVYHHKPVLRMTVDLEELGEVTSCDIPSFARRHVGAQRTHGAVVQSGATHAHAY